METLNRRIVEDSVIALCEMITDTVTPRAERAPVSKLRKQSKNKNYRRNLKASKAAARTAANAGLDDQPYAKEDTSPAPKGSISSPTVGITDGTPATEQQRHVGEAIKAEYCSAVDHGARGSVASSNEPATPNDSSLQPKPRLWQDTWQQSIQTYGPSATLVRLPDGLTPARLHDAIGVLQSLLPLYESSAQTDSPSPPPYRRSHAS